LIEIVAYDDISEDIFKLGGSIPSNIVLKVTNCLLTSTGWVRWRPPGMGSWPGLPLIVERE